MKTFLLNKLRKYFPLAAVLLLLAAALVLILPARNVQALPEYSAQTGEPCASCHISPSGGGPRGPRGQAWVGSGKPGAVPDLIAALETLGVHLEVDESAYTTVPEQILPAQAPEIVPAEGSKLFELLRDYGGN